VASVDSGEAALDALDRVRPDVISMDIRLPGLNGLEVTQAVMTRRPTPIVVVSASVESDDLRISMNALRAGALAVVEKPAAFGPQTVDAIALRLCETLVAMSQVRVIRQSRRLQANLTSRITATPRPGVVELPAGAVGGSMVGIVASTGGPPALVRLLEILTPRFPLPILLVQHISAGFLRGFARWLEELSGFPVRVVRGGEEPCAGSLYLPPEDHHLRLRGARLAVDQGSAVCFQRPSGTVLLDSLATALGRRAIGVVLTGMGEDGADGLKAIALAGGHTLAEDASSAVVYGMPGAAAERGAVSELLPLDALARRLHHLATFPPAP
jgi:two-component system chemotaxis response regulator CheB